jgi:hypothetical protein
MKELELLNVERRALQAEICEYEVPEAREKRWVQ